VIVYLPELWFHAGHNVIDIIQAKFFLFIDGICNALHAIELSLYFLNFE